MRAVLFCMLGVMLCGCTRAYYRKQADRETYHAIQERNFNPAWNIPNNCLEVPPQSRLFDPFNPDRPPMPPDDPGADRYMKRVNGIHGYRHWHKNGDAPWIEDPDWLNSLPLDEQGVLRLTPDLAVELGIIDSRDYQMQVENVYLNALALTLDRFAFDLHWFGTNDTTFTHFGSSADEQNTLLTSSMFGFTKLFAAGGQLMVDFANSFMWQFAGSPDHMTTQSNILINFVQPLLQSGGRAFVLEPLTEAERGLLYAVRDFAHYRKSFAFQLATQQFLSLLLQEQNIRNLEATLSSFEQNYRLHEALFSAGTIPAIKVDQAYLQVLQSRASLIQARAALETALDNYKILLGLPPHIPIKLDDSLLAPFQLSAPALTGLQAELDQFQAAYRQLDQAPPLADLRTGFGKLKTYHAQAVTLLRQVEEEFGRWQKQLAAPDEDKERAARERAAFKNLAHELEAVRDDLGRLAQDLIKAASALAEHRRTPAWEDLQHLVQRLIDASAQLFVIQTQVRVYLIRLRPVEWKLDEAVDFALNNRLDLMNGEARVVDAWRQITVTANQLEAVFNLVANANIATIPGRSNPVDFRASASSYSVGFQFEAPLNRVAQRNAYRASQVSYQQTRRAYMLLRDTIEEQIRLDLRNLETERYNFEIARLSLISAARQVEFARQDLLLKAEPDPTSTLNIIQALNAVLQAKNGLIGSWVSYETGRYQLLLDLEALQVNERGTYTDEFNNRTNQLPGPDAVLSADQRVPASGAGGQPAAGIHP
jgi:outer membrane protein TolC